MEPIHSLLDGGTQTRLTERDRAQLNRRRQRPDKSLDVRRVRGRHLGPGVVQGTLKVQPFDVIDSLTEHLGRAAQLQRAQP